uniref:NADH-quinone oxidoreductase subunit N n=1 Tax=Caenorhabditis tropicalis TaxID=1561998 RepID=A0A1I7UPW5_9PELO
MDVVDERLPDNFGDFMLTFSELVTCVVFTTYATPFAILPIVLIATGCLLILVIIKTVHGEERLIRTIGLYVSGYFFS